MLASKGWESNRTRYRQNCPAQLQVGFEDLPDSRHLPQFDLRSSRIMVGLRRVKAMVGLIAGMMPGLGAT
jgi:hypothetical protein